MTDEIPVKNDIDQKIGTAEIATSETPAVPQVPGAHVAAEPSKVESIDIEGEAPTANA